tara:strand:+ start:1379 stop:1552 length:174 start_codon:yes stop_codon:yes gene_type:complete
MSRASWMDKVDYLLNQLKWDITELEDLFEDDEALVEDEFMRETLMKLSNIRQRIKLL